MTPGNNLKKPATFAKNSNKKLLKNALMTVCLAGETNKVEREQVLKVLEETDFTYYVVMFRGNLGRSDYRALYCHEGGGEGSGISGTVYKLHGPPTVPDVLEDKMIEKFFRYESGSKAFKELTGIKSFTLTTDAITIKPAYLQKKQGAA
jgi:calmodulin-regulated spectrin-associated protein